MDVDAGDVDLGRYHLGRLIGSGGMGDVYVARDTTLRRDVAIKFVKTSATSDDALTRRLMQEARAVAALDHPYICPVYDVGVDAAGRPYMVMQYVEGETLATRLARGEIPARDALVMCSQIADALAAAHRRGIVHRDLKPQNVILTSAGSPKLLDFGIAKFVSALDGIGSDDTTTSLTRAHALVGTPAYMAPEQIAERPLDGRSDLFALGCILFECLTGRRAFAGRHTFELLDQIAHAHPPAPSSIRRGLDERHDALCRRLLAKDPADRFQSADELMGALRVLLPDTSRAGTNDAASDGRSWRRQRFWSRRSTAIIAAVLTVIAGAAAWRWSKPGLPAAPPDAQRYYQRGTDALREGSFHSAATALEEAVRLFPNYPLAYARLAEARSEMDDGRGAAQDLVRVSERVQNTSRLPRDERLRLDAIRSLVVGNVDTAVTAYYELAQRRPNDAGAWVDRGRAQEFAAQLTDARASYMRAVSLDPQYAAAYLRLGRVQSALGERDQSVAAYAEAERLYLAASNTEGQVEVLIWRGALFNKLGELKPAREHFERAVQMARTIGNPFQIVRAQMHLSTVIVSDGQFAEAERLAAAAVDAALQAGLDTAAADGLVDLALNVQTSRPAEARVLLEKAIGLGRRHGAQRTVARAASQMASLQLDEGRPQEALATLKPALDFFSRHKYRSFEITALLIASRAHQGLDDLKQAHDLASTAMKEAEITKDDSSVGVALGNLAAQAAVLGSLPEALALRDRAEAIHRRQQSVVTLPFDLTNRAELLVMLGRPTAAATALDEVEAGIQKNIDAYVRRRRRVLLLRALSAAVSNNFQEAERIARSIPSEAGGTDSASVLGPAILDYALAKQRKRSGVVVAESPLVGTPPGLARERLFWLAASAHARGNARDAFTVASRGVQLASRVGNDELQWRLAAIASVAARVLGQTEDSRVYRDRAVEARKRLDASWGAALREYDARPDLTALRTIADF
jgi:tetratricopeptide (TPR) repeat protein